MQPPVQRAAQGGLHRKKCGRLRGAAYRPGARTGHRPGCTSRNTPPNGAVILSQTYHADDLSPLQRLSLPVPRGQQLQPGAFTIRLEPIDLKGYVGFAIRYPDRYPGEFREDGNPVDADLVFFYFCAPAGLFSY
ncbi:MAG: hypothetical protein KBD67_07575 [Anaerolineaceae bacterium]|nr:hypothetical protein [Anaerolineaceae bacterium]